MRRAIAALVAVIGALALVSCSASAEGPVSGVVERNPDGFNGTVVSDIWSLPSTTLTDTSGAEVDVAARADKPLTLVFFGYTSCPDICIVVLSDLAAAIARLPEEQQSQVDMVMITSDPARDDAKTIRTYLDRFDPDFDGMTGSLADITAVGKAVGVDITEGDELPSGGYEVAHGTQVLGVVPGGEVRLVWTQGTSSAQFAEDIAKALTDGITDPAEEAS